MDEDGNIVRISERDVSRPFCPRRHRSNQGPTVGPRDQRGSGVGVIQMQPEMNL